MPDTTKDRGSLPFRSPTKSFCNIASSLSLNLCRDEIIALSKFRQSFKLFYMFFI